MEQTAEAEGEEKEEEEEENTVCQRYRTRLMDFEFSIV